MSEPKRYDFFLKAYTKQFVDVTGARYVYPDAGMTENVEGKYVEYSDYARLEKDFHQAHDERADYAKDVSKLKAEVDALKLGSLLTAVDVLQFIKLKEENERLTEIIRREVDGGVDLREEAQRTVEENHKLRAEVERLRKAVMHSPAAQLKLKELEGKTTYEEINPKEVQS